MLNLDDFKEYLDCQRDTMRACILKEAKGLGLESVSAHIDRGSDDIVSSIVNSSSYGFERGNPMNFSLLSHTFFVELRVGSLALSADRMTLKRWDSSDVRPIYDNLAQKVEAAIEAYVPPF